MWQFIKASQFIRGAGALFALLTLITEYLPYETLDLAAGFHAVIVGWNAISASIGVFISSILKVPAIPPEIINAAVLCLSIGPFWSFSILKSEWGQHRGAIQNTAFGARAVIGLLEVAFWSVMVMTLQPGLLFFLALFPLILCLLAVIRRLPTYRAGFLFALGFVAAMGGVYIFSSQQVQAAFDSFVCSQEGTIAPRCERSPE